MSNEEFNDLTSYFSLIATIVIQAILVILKFSKVVDWSWWIVLLPAEISLGAVVIVFIIIDIIFVVEMYKDYKKQKEKK